MTTPADLDEAVTALTRRIEEVTSQQAGLRRAGDTAWKSSDGYGRYSSLQPTFEAAKLDIRRAGLVEAWEIMTGRQWTTEFEDSTTTPRR